MQTRYQILTMLLVGLSFAKFAGAAAPRPNILYFYVDDMGWGSIGPNGQAQRKANGLPFVKTPNIDRLAKQGVNFTRGYACTVCSPSRASQQSGYHQGHAYADRNDPDNARKAMRADDVLMGDVLSAAGYMTGYWGKWGYGGSKDQKNPTIDNVQTLPTSHGYQHVLAELHHVRAHTYFQPTLWHAPAPAGRTGGLELVPNSMAPYRGDAGYPDTPALQNHDDYPETGYCDDAYAFAALDFVRTFGTEYHKSGKPFFGLLATQIPHGPFGDIPALPEWNSAYANDKEFSQLAQQTQQWAAMVTRIDAHFGNILAALEDPNGDGDKSDSVADDTLVVFQSDNGGPNGKNNSELDANGGLRGNKGQIFEGGIRVPLVMRWPRQITSASLLKAGSDSDIVVDITDLLPTFCDLAGADTPTGIDGVSIAPTLTGEGHQRKREFIIHEAGKTHSIIRGRHKLILSDKGQPRLYDLDADHAEANNIAANHPKLVKNLTTLLLGERVTEPKGFANTYHNWTGADGGDASDADNWSDYVYANAGMTYMTDDGAPQLSWTARMANTSSSPNTARAKTDLEFLGLEIIGDSASQTPQSLMLDPDVTLIGRNEVRISAYGRLAIQQGTVSSERWLDVRRDGLVVGTGTIDTTVYNAGSVAASGDVSLKITGDYHQQPTGGLSVAVTATADVPLQVEGNAFLNGELRVGKLPSIKAEPGTTFKALTSKSVTGSFSNADGEVKAEDGTVFAISYSDSAVTLTVK